MRRRRVGSRSGAVMAKLFEPIHRFRFVTVLVALVVYSLLTEQASELANPRMASAFPVTFVLAWAGAVLFAATVYFCLQWLSVGAFSPGDASPDRVAVIRRRARMLCLLLPVLFAGRWALDHGEIAVSSQLVVALLAAAAALIFLCFLCDALISSPPLSGDTAWLKVVLAGVGVFTVFAFVLAGAGHWLAAAAGGQFFLFIWAAALLLIIVGLQARSDPYRVPLLAILALWYVSVGYFHYGANHQIRRLASGGSVPEALNVDEAFRHWLSQRRDLDRYALEGRPYPVFVVAAEGGGAYAAINAGTVLAKLQDANPAFASHVFAISGVSGGSLGAAAFVSALLEHAKPVPGPQGQTCAVARLDKTGPVGPRMRDFLAGDFLSPLIAANLFHGPVQGLSPASVPALDPARMFEKALEARWDDTGVSAGGAGAKPRNAFREDFRSLWCPAGDVPAMVLNTTISAAGLPIHISPFHELAGADRKYVVGAGQIQFGPIWDMLGRDTLAEGANKKRIRLSTSVGISARFPYMFAPATISENPGTFFEFVDGGYYDNTGVNAAAYIRDGLLRQHDPIVKRVKRTLKGRQRFRPMSFEVYVLSIGSFDVIEASGRRTGSGGLLSPIQSIVNTRVFRTYNTRAMMRWRGVPEVTFQLDPDEAKFSLSFFLSPGTVEEIAARSGEAEACRVNPQWLVRRLGNFRRDVVETRSEVIAHNACSLRTIAQLLNS